MHLRQVFKKGESQVCEIRLNKNGEESFVRLESVGAKNAEGNVTECRTIMTDLTSHKQAAEALEQSEQRFRSVCESTEEVILINDKSQKITYANPAAEQTFGDSGSTLIGRTTEDVFGPESSAYRKDTDIRVLAGESVEEEHHRTVKGDPLVFLESRIPMRDRSGKVEGSLFFARDITNRRVKEFAPTEREPGYPSTAMKSTLKMARVAAPKGVTILLLGRVAAGRITWPSTSTIIHHGPLGPISPSIARRCLPNLLNPNFSATKGVHLRGLPAEKEGCWNWLKEERSFSTRLESFLSPYRQNC